MKQPELRKRWISAIVEYIRSNYVDISNETLAVVDAIVGPDTRGYLLAFAVALELQLPYLRIHVKEDSQVLGGPEDLMETTYRNRENKVNFLHDIHHSISQLFYLGKEGVYETVINLSCFLSFVSVYQQAFQN